MIEGQSSYITTSLLTDASLGDVVHRSDFMGNHYMMCMYPGLLVKAFMRSVPRFSILVLQRGRSQSKSKSKSMRQRNAMNRI